MSDVRRVAVFQPVAIDGARDPALFGAQLWIASRISELDGIEGMALMCFDEHALRNRRSWTPVGDGELGRSMAMLQAHAGLTSAYVRHAGRPRCERACLLEARDDAQWLLARELDVQGLPLAVAAHRMLCEIAAEYGGHAGVPEWTELFETEDPDLAGDYLIALGCYAAAIQGATIGELSPAFTAILGGIAARLRPAIRLLPALVDALEVSRGCSEVAIDGLVRAAVDIYGAVPAEWEAVCAAHGVGAPVRRPSWTSAPVEAHS